MSPEAQVKRYICIHGHFYQPPRENAWLEQIELQESAHPYHDWNERVTAECYAPNSTSHILDSEDYITRIVNNYAKISFNFGPTLLSWMESQAPEVYKAILDADKESQKTFSGHGSALAQVYNHMILPLAHRRDKYTQVWWGIRDFEHRFGRKPEGLWLPETAVDRETLDILAELGISFTILAPHQAQRVRQISTAEWEDVSGGRIDPTLAYVLRLPSGRRLSLFFYNESIARAVAFGGLLSSGTQLVQHLISAFPKDEAPARLVHIATDGETYGHHHRFGDMALAYVLDYVETSNLAKITNYGEFLEKYPPTHEVEIAENTSWSCAHGVERWRSDCGCNAGRNQSWDQSWRAPLRQTLDWLRDALVPKYEEKAHQLLKDPWAARNDYIAVILDRSPENVTRFLSRHANHELNEAERIAVLKLMELQRHAMLMYTSCGWFFDELFGIETVQVIQYAGRVVQLAEELFGDAIEPHFLERLGQAKSNVPEHSDGRHLYEKLVKPAMVNLTVVTAHFAISSLFEEYSPQVKVYCYRIELEDYQTFTESKMRLAIGRARITSDVTRESVHLCFGVLHPGDHTVNAGVQEYRGEEAYQAMLQEVVPTFSRADFPETTRLLNKHLGTSTYSLRNLFRDEQHNILYRLLVSALSGIEAIYRQLYQHHYLPMRLLTDPGSPVPRAFHLAAELILNMNLRRAFRSESLDLANIKSLLNESTTGKIDLDADGLGYKLKQTLDKMMARFMLIPDDLSRLKSLVDAVSLARSLPFPVDLWQVQSRYYQMLHTIYPEVRQKAQRGDEPAKEWGTQFVLLGRQLSIRIT